MSEMQTPENTERVQPSLVIATGDQHTLSCFHHIEQIAPICTSLSPIVSLLQNSMILLQEVHYVSSLLP